MRWVLFALFFVGCLTDPARYGDEGGGGQGGATSHSGGGAAGGGAAGAGGAGGAGGMGGSVDSHVVWVETAGGDEDQTFDAVAIGSVDEIYLGGQWNGAFDIPVVGGACTTSGATVAIVQALDGEGAIRWTRCFGEDASIGAIDANGGGPIAAIGTFRGNIDVGNGVTASKGGSDVFVVTLSSEGDILWGTTFGSTEDDEGQGVAVGAQSGAFVSGAFRGPMSIGTHPLSAPVQADLFFAKIVDGSGVWAKKATTAGPAPTMRIAIRQNAAGPIVAAGTFQGELDPDGPGALGPTAAADSGTDGFAFVFDVNGNVDAYLPLVAPGSQSISGVRASGSSAVLAGAFDGTIDYAAGNPKTASGTDAFALTMTFTGAVEDVVAIGGSGRQRGLAAAFDHSEASPMVVGGDFSGPTMLAGEMVETVEGADDGFVAYYPDAATEPSFAMRIGGDGPQTVKATVLFDGDILVAGSFADTLALGGAHAAAGARDAFIARIHP